MSRRYILLFMNSFRPRDWRRFGCDVFVRAGFEIVPVQLVAAPPDTFPVPVVLATDRRALENAVAQVAPDDVVLNLAPIRDDLLWVYRWLHDHDVPYVVMTRGGFPFSFRGLRGATGFRDWWRQQGRNILNLAEAIKRQLLTFAGRQGRYLPAPRWWLRAGERPVSLARSPFPRLRSAAVLSMEHFDVEADTEASAGRASGQPYALFIDQMMADHPDFQILGEQVPVDSQRYFAKLRQLFAQVERDLQLPVRIARHPKSDSDCAEAYGRPGVGKATAAAVRESSLVLCHDTTAVSFAVLNRRPIVFLTSDDLERSYIGVNVARTSSWLGQRRVNIDRLPPVLRFPKLQERDYDRFERAFLRSGETLRWCDVIKRIAGAQLAGGSRASGLSALNPQELHRQGSP